MPLAVTSVEVEPRECYRARQDERGHSQPVHEHSRRSVCLSLGVLPHARRVRFHAYPARVRARREPRQWRRVGVLAHAVQFYCDRVKIALNVDKIRLAGAFGTHIDVKYAMILGLIPDAPLEHVSSAGNAAGTGARIALLNKAARDEIEAVVRRIEKIETAVEPKFQQHFVEAMAIPHKTAVFANLMKVVKLPPVKEVVTLGDDGGTRRARRRG